MMKEYIEKLYKELKAVTERPVTLCRAEEAGVYALLRRRRGLRRESPGVLRCTGRGVSDGQGRPRSGGKTVRVL